MINVHNAIYKLDKIGGALVDINERLKIATGTLVGRQNVSDRPAEPPMPKSEIVSTDSAPFNFADAFEYQCNKLDYYLDYARDILGILETMTSLNPQQGPAGQEGGKDAAPSSFRGQLADKRLR
jgi:hypothetical protein